MTPASRRTDQGAPALQDVVERLQAFHGEPEPQEPTDPFEMVVWENIAYLVSDERRLDAYRALKKTVGLRPRDILRATRGESS